MLFDTSLTQSRTANLSQPLPPSWPPPPSRWILMPVPSTLGLTIQLSSSKGEICKITVTLMWLAGVVDMEVQPPADEEEEATRVRKGTQKSMLVSTQWRNGANYPRRSNRKSDVLGQKLRRLRDHKKQTRQASVVSTGTNNTATASSSKDDHQDDGGHTTPSSNAGNQFGPWAHWNCHSSSSNKVKSGPQRNISWQLSKIKHRTVPTHHCRSEDCADLDSHADACLAGPSFWVIVYLD